MIFRFLMCVNRDDGFLGSAITSVLEQDDALFEFIIVANRCSNELWESLNAIGDPRVRVYRTGVGQLAYNLNYGLDMAGDGYVLRMDADDVALPHRLSVTKRWLSEHEYPDIVGGHAIVIDDVGIEKGHIKKPLTNSAIRRSMWLRCPFVHPTCALKVSTVLGLRGYLGGFMSEDYDLWLRAARDRSVIFGNIDEFLIKYRISEGQARGRPLGYCEAAGHLYREALYSFRPDYLAGSIVASVKRVVLPRAR